MSPRTDRTLTSGRQTIETPYADFCVTDECTLVKVPLACSGGNMDLGVFGAAIPAIIVIVVVLVLEEWAYFKARSKLQRAVIIGVAVFIIFLVLNLIAGPSF